MTLNLNELIHNTWVYNHWRIVTGWCMVEYCVDIYLVYPCPNVIQQREMNCPEIPEGADVTPVINKINE